MNSLLRLVTMFAVFGVARSFSVPATIRTATGTIRAMYDHCEISSDDDNHLDEESLFLHVLEFPARSFQEKDRMIYCYKISVSEFTHPTLKKARASVPRHITCIRKRSSNIPVDFDDSNARASIQRREDRAKTMYTTHSVCASKNRPFPSIESDATRPDGREWKVNFKEEVDIMEVPNREESEYADWDDHHDATITILEQIKRRISSKQRSHGEDESVPKTDADELADL